MFKRLVIELEQPFCDCPQSGFVWKIEGTVENQHSLNVQCRTCGASLDVAPEDLKARITLSRMRAPTRKQANRRWSRDGNVITIVPADVRPPGPEGRSQNGHHEPPGKAPGRTRDPDAKR